MGWLVGGGGKPRSGGAKRVTSYGLQLSPIVAQKVAKSLDNITSKLDV